MKHFLLAVCFSSLSMQALAYDGWSDGEISRIRVQSNKILINQVSPSNPGECLKSDYIYLPQGEEAYHKNMFSTLLTAYATKQPVKLALKGCSPNGYPVVSEVWVR